MSPFRDINLYLNFISMAKNRNLTEQRLINAVEDLIIEKGFEKLGVNAVANKAGVDKKLIYRYFGSLDGLIRKCLEKNDFWSNVPIELPEHTELKDYLKTMFRKQIVQFRENDILRHLARWELSNNNDIINELGHKKEETGLQRINTLANLLKIPYKEAVGLATIITAGITYLSMLEEKWRYYNGIDITSDEGWENIAKTVDKIIDLISSEYENN